MRCCPHVKAEEFLDYDDEIAAEELESERQKKEERKKKENKEKTIEEERLIDQMDPERAEVKSHLIELNQDECSYCGKEISTEIRIEKEINKIKSSFCSEECLKEFLDAIDYVDDYK